MNRLTLLGMAFLYAASAQATTLPYKDLDSLAAESEGIVVGTVSNIESHYGYDKNIYTFVTLENLEPVKGRFSQQDFVLRFTGGQIGNDILNLEGSPHFEPNERVILFIHGNGRELVPLVGWTQGLFRIGENRESGQGIVLDHEGNRVLGISGQHLIKERTFAPLAHILGEGLEDKASNRAKAGAGTTDDGSASALAAERQAATPSRPRPVGVAKFLDSVKKRVAREARKAPSAQETQAIESADLPDAVDQNDEAPAGGEARGLGTDAIPATNQPVLPKRMSTKGAN